MAMRGVIPLPPPTRTMRRGPLAEGGVNDPEGPSTSSTCPSQRFSTRCVDTRPFFTRFTVTDTRAGSSGLLEAE